MKIAVELLHSKKHLFLIVTDYQSFLFVSHVFYSERTQPFLIFTHKQNLSRVKNQPKIL